MPITFTLDDHREKARAWQAFLDFHGRQPGKPKNVENALPGERLLYDWMARARAANSQGRLDASVRAILDEFTPSWQEKAVPGPTLQEHRERAEAWLEFLEANGRQPRGRSGLPPDEIALYTWMRALRSAEARGVIHAKVRSMLDDTIPSWRERQETRTLSLEEQRNRAQAWTRFRDEHGHQPGSRDPAPLYEWIYFHRRAEIRGVLDPAIRAILDEEAPDWRSSEGRGPRRSKRMSDRDDETLVRIVKKRRDERKAAAMARDEDVPTPAIETAPERPAAPPPPPQDLPTPTAAPQETPPSPEDLEIVVRRRSGGKSTLTTDDHRERAMAWAAYSAERGREPRPNRGPNESFLYSWMYFLRKADTAGTLDDDVRDMLDEIAPAWRTRPSRKPPEPDLHSRRATAYAAFIEHTGSRPRQRGGNAEERSLGIWMATLRRRIKRDDLPLEIRSAVSVVLPGWDSPSGALPHELETMISFPQRIESLRNYLDEHNGILPPKYGDDDGLGLWLVKQRVLLRRGELDPEHERALDDLVSPKWRDDRNEVVWESRAESFANFRMENGRLPRTASGDEHERMLGRWLKEQRRHATPRRVAILDAAVPDWRGAAVPPAWTARVHDLEQHVREHGRRPGAAATTQAEYSLWIWLDKQRAEFQAGNLIEDQILMLNRALPRWEKTSKKNR